MHLTAFYCWTALGIDLPIDDREDRDGNATRDLEGSFEVGSGVVPGSSL